jgi:hypothetical protein
MLAVCDASRLGPTFELKRTVEAGAVSRDTENVHRTCGPAYSACRSGSRLSEGLGVAFGARQEVFIGFLNILDEER